jgi:hypothetical protein
VSSKYGTTTTTMKGKSRMASRWRSSIISR